MKLTARTIKHAILGLAIAGTAAAGVGTAVPHAHADPIFTGNIWFGTIDGYSTIRGEGFVVTGQNFTPGGAVQLDIYYPNNTDGTIIHQEQVVTANPAYDQVCSAFGFCWSIPDSNPGTFTASGMSEDNSCSGSITVKATDETLGQSVTTAFPVNCIS